MKGWVITKESASEGLDIPSRIGTGQIDLDYARAASYYGGVTVEYVDPNDVAKFEDAIKWRAFGDDGPKWYKEEGLEPDYQGIVSKDWIDNDGAYAIDCFVAADCGSTIVEYYIDNKWEIIYG